MSLRDGFDVPGLDGRGVQIEGWDLYLEDLEWLDAIYREAVRKGDAYARMASVIQKYRLLGGCRELYHTHLWMSSVPKSGREGVALGALRALHDCGSLQMGGTHTFTMWVLIAAWAFGEDLFRGAWLKQWEGAGWSAVFDDVMSAERGRPMWRMEFRDEDQALIGRFWTQEVALDYHTFHGTQYGAGALPEDPYRKGGLDAC